MKKKFNKTTYSNADHEYYLALKKAGMTDQDFMMAKYLLQEVNQKNPGMPSLSLT